MGLVLVDNAVNQQRRYDKSCRLHPRPFNFLPPAANNAMRMLFSPLLLTVRRCTASFEMLLLQSGFGNYILPWFWLAI